MTRNEIEASLKGSSYLIDNVFIADLLQVEATHLIQDAALVLSTIQAILEKLQNTTEEELAQFALVIQQLRNMAMDVYNDAILTFKKAYIH